MGLLDFIYKETKGKFEGKVSLADAPKVIGIFCILTCAYTSSLFVGCFLFRPTHRLVAWSPKLKH
jgi:hypothetical protein